MLFSNRTPPVDTGNSSTQMEWHFNPDVLLQLQKASMVLAYLVLLGAAAEIGYWTLEALRLSVTDALVVKGTVALSVLAAALSILSPSNFVSRTLSWGALGLYLMMLLQYFIEIRWGAGELPESSLHGLSEEPALIPASTTTCLVFFSISLHLLRSAKPRYLLGHLLLLGLFVFVYALLLAHVLGSAATFQGIALYAIIPVPTLGCFALLSLALLLLYPDQGLTRMISASHAGSRYAREAFIAIAILPLLIGVLVAAVLKNFDLPAEAGIVLFFFLYFPVFLTLAYLNYQKINQYDFQRGKLLDDNDRINEELRRANAQMATLNDELRATLLEYNHVNEQLIEANREINNLMEERLSQSELKFRELTESITEMFFALDNRLNFLYWNKACEQLTGKPAPELIGSSVYGMFPGFRGGRAETVLLAVLKSREPVNYEHLDKATGKYFEVWVFPSKTGLSVLVKDITEKKKKESEILCLNAELSRRNQELDEGNTELDQRNFELDQIVYKISHDIRSPLASVLGLLQLMRLEGIAGGVEEYLARMQEQISKLDRFTKAMLDFARTTRSEVQCQAIDFEGLLHQCLSELEYMPHFARLHFGLQVEGEPLYNDIFRMRIILSNLLANSVKYQHLERHQSFLHIRVRVQQEQATLVFEDNGIGIEEQHVPKIFDMFFRASEQSTGSGLGMYIVKQTVEKLGGTIGLESTFGEGTSVTIRIPNQANDPACASPAPQRKRLALA
jgi:PAS domain S-box-containing protein